MFVMLHNLLPIIIINTYTIGLFCYFQRWNLPQNTNCSSVSQKKSQDNVNYDTLRVKWKTLQQFAANLFIPGPDCIYRIYQNRPSLIEDVTINILAHFLSRHDVGLYAITVRIDLSID